MPVFEKAFTVNAPLAAVAAFHASTHALQRLTPPPIFAQWHHVEPLAENSRAVFTLWFGPLPVRWTAIHSQVDSLHGFTDTQISGPMAAWRHTHRFEAVSPTITRVRDHIEYTYAGGWRGLWTRLLFNPLGLGVMFAYRAWVTRRLVSRERS